MGRKIPLRVSNKKAYVWDVDDIAALRAECHVCGVLMGTLPHLSQQNVFLGVPLVLMPEEVVLLVRKGFAVLIDDPQAHKAPLSQAASRWNTERKEAIKLQIAAAEVKESSEKAAKHALSEDALRKRREREERRAAAARQKALMEGDFAAADTPFQDLSPVPPDARPSTPTLTAAAAYTLSIPVSSAVLEWYNEDGCTYSTLEDAREAGIWDYPVDAHERAKCGVFQDLWQKGFYMGGGIRFGGDFLVYPGDPLRYHSHFVATVIDAPISTLRPMEIVAHGRLGTATKKAHLLCGWDNVKEEVSYFSIEWAGFG
ncbi:tRNA-intron endonuclease catalytic domain-like protein [Obba rivulosa]|uniref:tRNA-splicing endonuclease subunit Sen34 n=1 Tax=Obba rivulosa TaxID=1052685 RepID=A0A8E2AX25_9APHY|nr:tRNA-intron endonuclease catalytic domain-like protein [Obba rivulosa]